ncbi:MAG: 16S rRNA (cytosine(1402)-N(4))-methyltransferase RsmH [Erysipelotrichales bacterium]|nr:16S rRNA (cytosine(1402)-N(4))-methyltransferase RsmH [Erysipelotrichales bacterium]
MDKHIPVMLNEVIDNLCIKNDGIYVDCTLGRAGHSSEILKRIPNGHLYGFDQDQKAIDESKSFLSTIANNFTLIHENFVNVKDKLNELGVNSVDGILMDLGVSSPQFDDGERGFSYRYDARLDMRMNQSDELDAHYIINNYSLNELTRIFREYGEEKYAYNIAKNIVKVRESKTINTTFELVDIIKSSLPKKELMKKGHPAKQVFQALRIETNHELDYLTKVLDDVLSLLKVGGRLAIITFHSLEDRIVKKAFKRVSEIEGSRHAPVMLPNEENKPNYRLVNRQVIVASEEELKNNPRSQSAKLRIIERI